MARPPFLLRLRRLGRPASAEPSSTPAEDGDASTPRRRPLPPAGRLRRQKRTLLRQREERIRDLGGLVLEMYRRDDYRQELVDERCAELTGLEERLYELDVLLRASAGARRPAPAARCECGTPIPWGASFCATCGRPVGETSALACETCGAALSADARFCAACGVAIAPAGEAAPPDPEER